MSDAAHKQAEVVAYDEPRFINTKWAAVAVYGWQLISEVMLEKLAMCLNLPFWNDGDHGVRVVNLRGEFHEKEDRLGECWVNGQGIGINLANHFDRACLRTQESQPSTSIYSWYVMNVIVTLLHEAHHLSQLVLGEDFSAERAEKSADEETAAETFANDSLLDLAKTFNMEPDEWTNEPFFKDLVLGEGLGDDDPEWLDHQLHMLDNRLFFFRPEVEGHTELKFHTFKDYLHYFSGDDANDETWMGEPIPVPPIARATADIHPAEAPKAAVVGGATEAMNVMADQAANMGVTTPVASEALPSSAIAMGYEPAASVVNHPNGSVSITPVQPAGQTQEDLGVRDTQVGHIETEPMVDMEYMEDMEDMGDVVSDAFIDQLIDSPPPATPAAGAPGTPFVMNGQPVGTNVQPDAPAPGPVVNTYQPTSMDDATLISVIQGIYSKIYNHIFGYCGQYAGGFTHPSKVYEMAIELDERESEAVVKMDCLDHNGRWCAGMPSKYELQGQVKARIIGATTKSTGMPYYKLFLNGNGQEICRFIIPQNPQKKAANGQFSKPALAAQSGSRILYIMEGNDDIVKAGGKKVLCKIVDGSMQA